MKVRKIKKDLDLLEKKNLHSLSRIFLSSLVVISFFYITPIFIDFANKNFNNKEFTNNSFAITNSFPVA